MRMMVIGGVGGPWSPPIGAALLMPVDEVLKTAVTPSPTPSPTPREKAA